MLFLPPRSLVPTIWLRPPGATQRRDADAAKALLTVPDGDHLTLLNVYNQYILSEYSISGRWAIF